MGISAEVDILFTVIVMVSKNFLLVSIISPTYYHYSTKIYYKSLYISYVAGDFSKMSYIYIFLSVMGN
ncbi:MAG: hypothetical protein ACTSVY_15900 [Candidatus Helarchaeota archaeon]